METRAGNKTRRRYDPIANLTVRVQPGARKERIIGFTEDVLRVAVQAPPVEGAANRAVIRLLARFFDTKPSRIQLVRGQKSRTKTVDLVDVTPEALQQHLDRIITRPG